MNAFYQWTIDHKGKKGHISLISDVRVASATAVISRREISPPNESEHVNKIGQLAAIVGGTIDRQSGNKKTVKRTVVLEAPATAAAVVAFGSPDH